MVLSIAVCGHFSHKLLYIVISADQTRARKNQELWK